MKIKLHIDTKAYKAKPSGSEMSGIKTRLQKGKIPVSVAIDALIPLIGTGYSISRNRQIARHLP